MFDAVLVIILGFIPVICLFRSHSALSRLYVCSGHTARLCPHVDGAENFYQAANRLKCYLQCVVADKIPVRRCGSETDTAQTESAGSQLNHGGLRGQPIHRRTLGTSMGWRCPNRLKWLAEGASTPRIRAPVSSVP